MPETRYDGVSAWYDDFVASFAPSFARLLAARARGYGAPGDLVFDVGCGTGLAFDALLAAGLVPIGLELSGDQLRLARTRGSNVVPADAVRLPFRDAALGLSVASFVHTDVDDFAAVVAEVARVLRASGTFADIGTHPCFVGPFVKRVDEQAERQLVVRRGYGDEVLSLEGSGSTTGLNSRVGSAT